jgi:hypothetical protein
MQEAQEYFSTSGFVDNLDESFFYPTTLDIRLLM